MPLMPLLEWATDLAATSARFNASGEAMSGRFAPLRTATPMPERARSTRLPATTLPPLMRSSIASAVRMARSPPAPSRSFKRLFVAPQVIMTFVPLVRSNAGTRSTITDFTPLVQRISIAAILSRFQSFRVDAGWTKMPLLKPERESQAPSIDKVACRRGCDHGQRKRTHELGRRGAVPDRLSQFQAARGQGGRARCGERTRGQTRRATGMAARDVLHLDQVRGRTAQRRELVDAGLAQRSRRSHQGAGRGGGDRRSRGDGIERRHQRAGRRGHRRSLRRAQGDDHGADRRQRTAINEELSKTLAAL